MGVAILLRDRLGGFHAGWVKDGRGEDGHSNDTFRPQMNAVGIGARLDVDGDKFKMGDLPGITYDELMHSHKVESRVHQGSGQLIATNDYSIGYPSIWSHYP